MSTFGDRPAFPMQTEYTWAANDTTTWESEPKAIAQRAVAIADATLKELEKEGR